MIKLRVTKKQQRIIDAIMSQLNDRQRKYVEENHSLFPGSSILPFIFYLSFDSDTRWGTRLIINALLSEVKTVNHQVPDVSVVFFSEFVGDEIPIDFFWQKLCEKMAAEWHFLKQFVLNESKYLPMLQNIKRYD